MSNKNNEDEPSKSTPEGQEGAGARSGTNDGRIDLRSFRSEDEPEWELPQWENPLSQGVFPLLRQHNDRLYPIGTAFCVSRFGIVATAKHCIDEAVRNERNPRSFEGPGHHDLKDNGLSVLHYQLVEPDVMRFTVWPITNVAGAPPTDAVFGSLVKETPPTALLSPRLSPGLPETGTRVLTVGYRFPDELAKHGMSASDIRAGTFDWRSKYQHKLMVVEGRVGTLFLHRHRFVGGPCFLTGQETYPGQSGGPVFNDEGNVCGIHSGCTLDEGGIASMIYPTLTAPLKVTFNFGPSFKMNLEQPVGYLMLTGAIRTDGTEQLVRLTQEPQGVRIDPIFPKDAHLDVYDDAHSHSDGSPSKRLPLRSAEPQADESEDSSDPGRTDRG